MQLPSPNRIDLDDPANVMLWADMMSISVERLREIVARVGPMAPAVKFYVAKSENAPRARGPSLTVNDLIGGVDLEACKGR
jgi:Protein of unknown function (DUF3606)